MPRTTRTQALLAPQRSVIALAPDTWPRSYQKPALKALLGSVTRAGVKVPPVSRLITVWHRRAGKDYTWLFGTVVKMLQRPGTYYHVFPTLVQGRGIVWDGIDTQGNAYLDLFPPELVAEKNETELMIRLKPVAGFKVGSIWQILGTDNLQKRRGLNPAGAVFSEYQDMPPSTFEEIFEPPLLANGGWAGFCFTPRGRNHAYDLWNAARADARWFSQMLTIAQTRRDAPGEDGAPVVDAAMLEDLRIRGVPEEIIQQEYYCSFEGALRGAIFGKVLATARADGRICRVPYEVNLPVKTAWDLGKRDGTAIWFYQTVGREYRFIDYWFGRGMDISQWVHVCKEQKLYTYNDHLWPWDADMDYGFGQTRREVAEGLGLRPIRAAQKLSIEEGIDAGRRVFSRCVFDEVKCAKGLENLAGYRYEWDDRKQEYGATPVHDEHSHAGSAFRTFAVDPCDHNDDERRRTQQTHASMNWNPHAWATEDQPDRYARMG